MDSTQRPPAGLGRELSRRGFVKSAAAAMAAAWAARPGSAADAVRPSRRVVVGGHPWVYAATRPNFDITPVLPQIFDDLSYAGMMGVELMHPALRPDDAVARIGELSRRSRLPVIGMSFSGAMWDRQMHPMVLNDARLVIPRLAALGGRTLGTSVGPVRWGVKIPKTEQQLDDQADLLRQLIGICERARRRPQPSQPHLRG